MRPKSFLHEEMNEFDRIFSEMFFSPHKRMSLLVADIIAPDDDDDVDDARHQRVTASEHDVTAVNRGSWVQLRCDFAVKRGLCVAPVRRAQPSATSGATGR